MERLALNSEVAVVEKSGAVSVELMPGVVSRSWTVVNLCLREGGACSICVACGGAMTLVRGSRVVRQGDEQILFITDEVDRAFSNILTGLELIGPVGKPNGAGRKKKRKKRARKPKHSSINKFCPKLLPGPWVGDGNSDPPACGLRRTFLKCGFADGSAGGGYGERGCRWFVITSGAITGGRFSTGNRESLACETSGPEAPDLSGRFRGGRRPLLRPEAAGDPFVILPRLPIIVQIPPEVTATQLRARNDDRVAEDTTICVGAGVAQPLPDVGFSVGLSPVTGCAFTVTGGSADNGGLTLC